MVGVGWQVVVVGDGGRWPMVEAGARSLVVVGGLVGGRW